MSQDEEAVRVERAVAGYGDKKILSGLSMRVKKGSIYALLGPSGCGKTTLLSCILGRKSLEGGEISVFNGVPGDRSIGLPGSLVGYMPQDICLYMEFTIQETFQYFGRLQKLSSDSLEKRQTELLDLLELPEASRRVSALSGGQKRRLSFAVALLHSPKILILDEPTVGVDPVVRARIWSHLQSLTHTGVTIIITTHYIEEARDANMVGIMRNGRLLAQEPPTMLMERHQAQTLEKVFLRLCNETDQMEDYELSIETQTLPKILISNGKSADLANDNNLIKEKLREITSFVLPSVSNIAALFQKNWIKMKRNILLLTFVFCLPASILLVNSLTTGLSPKDLPLALVNLEGDCSDESYISKCEASMLGCYFKRSLNQSQIVNLIPYTNISEAESDVREANIRGMVVIPEDLSVSYLKRILGVQSWRWDQFLFFYDVVDDGVDTNQTVNIALDASDPQLVLFIKKAITEAVDDMVNNITSLCKEDLGDVGIDLSVINLESPLLGYEDSDYREWTTPGMICVSLFFSAMALTSESFITERSQGLLERSWITGVLPVEIIASYIMSQFLVMVIQATITFITVFLVFQIPCHGPIAWCMVLALLQGLAGMSFGFFLSTVVNTSADAVKISIGTCLNHLLLCGILWPLEGMPRRWMMTVARTLPHTEAVQGMRDVMQRGWGITQSASISYGIVISSSWILALLTLSWILVGKKMR